MSENDNTITYNEVIERLKEKAIEEYTKSDLFDRYIAYGTEEELKRTDVQNLFLKYECIDLLLDMVSIITDKEIISKVLKSDVTKAINLKAIKGKVIGIKNDGEWNIKIEFINELNNIYELDYIDCTDLVTLKSFEDRLSKYNNKDIIAIIEEDTIIRCFMKYYKDIEYKFE